MIGRTILTALVLFLSYDVFVSQLAPVWWGSSQHQWQDNVIKAQKYIDDDVSFRNVIVGSSLSCRIKTDSLYHTYNLAFQGQSIFDGLSVINQCRNKPQYVLIEINMLIRPEKKEFVSSINSPGLKYLREHLVAMREKNQPIGAVGKYVNIRVRRLLPNPKSASVKNQPKSFFEELLNKRKNAYARPVDSAQLKHSIDELKKYVRELETSNVKVVFYEMPMDDVLVHSLMENQIRKQFCNQFDTTIYKFIAVPADRKHVTTDGLHLTEEESRVYSGYLKSQLTWKD